MNEIELKKALSSLSLGGLRYFDSTGSTNDLALAWAADGAADMSLVVADEQTTGRGRMGRKWFTPPGSALAFSLILRPCSSERASIGLISGLGALALVDALKGQGLEARIKWPNDVLIQRKKVCGILAEAVWLGTEIESIVLGMGVNVASESVPPSDAVHFPATSIQTETGQSVDRLQLLVSLLSGLVRWRALLGTDDFIHAWEDALEFRGELVQVRTNETESLMGRVEGLEADGGLLLGLTGGEIRAIRFGEVHLRPV